MLATTETEEQQGGDRLVGERTGRRERELIASKKKKKPFVRVSCDAFFSLIPNTRQQHRFPSDPERGRGDSTKEGARDQSRPARHVGKDVPPLGRTKADWRRTGGFLCEQKNRVPGSLPGSLPGCQAPRRLVSQSCLRCGSPLGSWRSLRPRSRGPG